MNTGPRRTATVLLASAGLAALAWTTQTVPATAQPASTCGQLVQRTRADPADAGAPTGDTDWQAVRDDAQRFINDHPWGGAAVRKLQSDIGELDSTCAP